MTSVFVVTRNKTGLGFSTDIPDRVYFHEADAKKFVEAMNHHSKVSHRKGDTMFMKEYSYRKMPVYGRGVKLDDPVPHLEVLDAPKRRKRKDEKQIEGVAKPRNPYVQHLLKRPSGAHQKTKKAERRLAKMSLLRDLAPVA